MKKRAYKGGLKNPFATKYEDNTDNIYVQLDGVKTNDIKIEFRVGEENKIFPETKNGFIILSIKVLKPQNNTSKNIRVYIKTKKESTGENFNYYFIINDHEYDIYGEINEKNCNTSGIVKSERGKTTTTCYTYLIISRKVKVTINNTNYYYFSYLSQSFLNKKQIKFELNKIDDSELVDNNKYLHTEIYNQLEDKKTVSLKQQQQQQEPLQKEQQTLQEQLQQVDTNNNNEKSKIEDILKEMLSSREKEIEIEKNIEREGDEIQEIKVLFSDNVNNKYYKVYIKRKNINYYFIMNMEEYAIDIDNSSLSKNNMCNSTKNEKSIKCYEKLIIREIERKRKINE